MPKFGFIISGDVPFTEDARGLSTSEQLELFCKQAQEPVQFAKEIVQELSEVHVRIFMYPEPQEFEVCPTCNAADYGNATCATCHQDWVERGRHNPDDCPVCKEAAESVLA